MSRISRLTAATLAPRETKPRLSMALAVVALSALMPTGSWACGQLPAGVEHTGPVLRGEAAPQGGETQPIIYPHCSSGREPAGSAVALAPGKPSKAAAKTVERPAEAN